MRAVAVAVARIAVVCTPCKVVPALPGPLCMKKHMMLVFVSCLICLFSLPLLHWDSLSQQPHNASTSYTCTQQMPRTLFGGLDMQSGFQIYVWTTQETSACILSRKGALQREKRTRKKHDHCPHSKPETPGGSSVCPSRWCKLSPSFLSQPWFACQT